MGFGSPNGGERRRFFMRGVSKVLGHAAEAIAERFAPPVHIRPPGALSEAAFLAACTRCGECAPVCPAGAIALLPREAGLAAGTPALRPATTACVMCADMPCVRACPTGALSAPSDGWLGVRMGRAEVDEGRCIAHRDVACGVCARVCPVGTSALALDRGGRPVVGDACTGCGACAVACVTVPSSITIRVAREVA